MLIDKVSGLFPFIITIVAITIGGWVITTWLRIKNGYPLDGAWGQALLPPLPTRKRWSRIKLLGSENAFARRSDR